MTVAAPAADLDPRGATPFTRHAYVIAVLVLVGSLVLVLLYARAAGERERTIAEGRFVAEAELMATLMRQTLSSYELTTRGGVSLFATVDGPSGRQWRNYVDGLDIGRRFPAMVGLGYAAYLSPSELEALQLQRRRDGDGLFSVTPAGLRARYGPIVRLEPATPENLSAVGFDMYADPVRAEAMAAARDAGTARVSGPVRLLQDATAPDSVGLLIFAPVYRSGFTPAGRAARDSALAGWVYAPLRMRDFVANAVGDLHPHLRFRIVDIGPGGDQRLFASPGMRAAEADDDVLRHVLEEAVHGRTWRIEFEQVLTPGSWWNAVRGTVAVGLLASLLLFAVMLSLARTQAAAQRMATRMSESYRRSELRFRNAMRYSAIGKALLDARGHIVDANLALADTLRSSPDELAGVVFWKLFVDGHEDVDDEGLLQVRATGVYRATRRLVRSDGDLRHVHLTFAPVPGEIGQDVAALVQVEDVTDRLRAVAQVHALNQDLEARVALRTRELTRANDALESFAYSVSHDLRAPLRAIDGFSRLLVERYADAIDAPGRDHLARIRAATVRMGELIDALLKMSRLSRGEFRRVPLDLGRMAEEVVCELRQSTPGRAVEVDIQPGLRAEGDAALMHNLLANLLGNAWKFTGATAAPRIEFGAEGEGEGRTFFIRDNGAGFPQAYVDKLFRPFQRLHGQAEFPGHGIGLASVKRIVERHGGWIRAEGREGEGACFRFTLSGDGASAG